VIVRVHYTTQLKHALQRASDEVDVAAPLTVGQLLQHLSQLHGEPFNNLVLASPDTLNPSMLVCVGNA
jgi:hypothetical protein